MSALALSLRITRYRDNPHLQQAFVNDQRLEQAGRPLAAADLVISREWKPWAAYQSRKNMAKTLPENRPRGGLLLLIDFLTKVGAFASRCVCFGPDVVVACERVPGLRSMPDCFIPGVTSLFDGVVRKSVLLGF